MRRLGMAAAIGAALGAAMPAAGQVGFGYDGAQFLAAVRDGDGSKATALADSSGPSVINYRGDDGDAALHIVTRVRSTNWMGYLLQKGADPNLAGRDGDTPLVIAARIGFAEGAARLLSKGANIDKANKLGETPLIAAVQQRQPAMIKMLNAVAQRIIEPKHVSGGGPTKEGQAAPGASARPSAAQSMYPNLKSG